MARAKIEYDYPKDKKGNRKKDADGKLLPSKHPGCWLEIGEKGGVFYCRYKHPVTKKDTKAKFKSPLEGGTFARCAHFRADLIRGITLSPQEKRRLEEKKSAFTVAAMADRYFKGEDEDGILYSSKSQNKSDVCMLKNHLLPYWKKQSLEDVSKSQLMAFRVVLKKKNLADQTIKHNVAFLQRIMNYSELFVHARIWKAVKPQRLRRVAKKGFLAPSEVQSLRDVMDTHHGRHTAVQMMRLSMTFGCRISELTRLDWKNVDLKAGTVTFVNRKGGAPDLIHQMDEEVRGVLKTIQGRTIKISGLVFPNTAGVIKDTNVVGRAFRKILNKAGIDKSFKPTHGFRDNAAYWLYKAEGLEAARRFLGHTSSQTTLLYLKGLEVEAVSGVSVMSAMKAGVAR